MFAVAVISNFSLQAVLRHEPGLASRAVALVDPELPKPDIVQLTAAARARGVEEGFTPSQAMARCGDLIIRNRSLVQEQAATTALLQIAYAFAAHIEATAPGVCTMELKGLGLQFHDGTAAEWASNLLQVYAGIGLNAQIGFAATPELALIAARAAKPLMHVVARASSPASSSGSGAREVPTLPQTPLATLSLAALEPSPGLLDILQRWGIRTAGALLDLGKDRVVERLGPDAANLFNRVSTDFIRPLKLVTPPDDFTEVTEFEIAIETVEPLLFMLRRFVEQLSRRVELIYLVVAELHLRLGLASGAAYEHTFRIPAPTANVDTLFRMLQTHLENVRTDSPIIALQLSAKPGKADTHQFGLFETTLRDPNQFAETLARLTALCGTDCVGTPEPQSTHRPDVFRMKLPEFDSRISADGTGPTRNTGTAQNGEWPQKGTKRHKKLPKPKPTDLSLSSIPNGGEGWGEEALFLKTPGSPLGEGRETSQAALNLPSTPGLALRRFRPALTIHLEFREQRPALLRSSLFNGAITDVRGPFLGSGNWWDSARWSREEWDIQTADGTLYRIFRSPEGCFMEGVYD